MELLNPLNDEQHLENFERQLRVVRDFTRKVAEGWGNGFYLFGDGGTSKSFSVERTLTELGRPYRLTNSRLTGKGVFDLLRDDPDIVHVLDDIEPLLADKNAFGVLRSALWGPERGDGKQLRQVTWHTAKGREDFVFTGGLILIANRAMGDFPELKALQTRMSVFELAPSNEQVVALMRKIAQSGYRYGEYCLAPDACLEAVEAIVKLAARMQRRFDLRLLHHVFSDRLQFEHQASQTDWRELLEIRMNQRLLPNDKPIPKSERKRRQQEVARRIAKLPPSERLKVWKTEVSRSQATLYRRLGEAGSTPAAST